MIDTASKPHFDLEAVREAAGPYWRDILHQVGGIPMNYLDGRHHDCPICNQGKDCFRLVDQSAGAILCNRCFSTKNGDGFSALQRITGQGFLEVVELVADFCGIKPSSNGSGASNKQRKDPIKGVQWSDDGLDGDVDLWCQRKQPITPDAVSSFGGRLCSWPRRNGQPCLAFTSSEGKAVLLYRLDGEPFPAFGRLLERKTHLVGGSVESWLVPGSLGTTNTIHKCEGLPDALTLHSIGLPVDHAAITNVCGAKSTGRLDFSFAKGKRVVIAADADRPGIDGAQRHAVQFHRAGAASVKIVTPPGYEVTAEHGRDFRDWFAEGHTAQEYLALVGATKPVTVEQVSQWAKTTSKPSAVDSGRPTIILGTDQPRVIDEAIDALATRPEVYRRGGQLVHIIHEVKPPRGIERETPMPGIIPIKEARLCELLSAGANWGKESTKNGETRIQFEHPPRWLVKAVDARDSWPAIRPIEGIVEAPTLRADGSVLQTPGYDASTGVYFEPRCRFSKISDRLTVDDARRAVDDLLEVVCDFPFSTPAHRAGWLSGVLTPFARFAFHGPSPLHAVDANAAGSGKSLLVDCISSIAFGRRADRMADPGDDAEWRKRILSLALAGQQLVLVDNLGTEFGSPSLDAALTATSWSDRILSRSEMAREVPLLATWYASGNNVILKGDTARRTLHIRLDAMDERPEERTGFRHPALLDWIAENRPRLAVAGVTILAAYFQAGRPTINLPPWGSYEAWSSIVRQALVWAGQADPAETRVELSSHADLQAEATRKLVEGWHLLDPEGYGLKPREVLDALRHNAKEGYTDDGESLVREALDELIPNKRGDLPSTQSLGMKLAKIRRKVVTGGKYIDSRSDGNHSNYWFVVQVGPNLQPESASLPEC